MLKDACETGRTIFHDPHRVPNSPSPLISQSNFAKNVAKNTNDDAIANVGKSRFSSKLSTFESAMKQMSSMYGQEYGKNEDQQILSRMLTAVLSDSTRRSQLSLLRILF